MLCLIDSCHQGRMLFFKLTGEEVFVFDWIAGLCHVNLLKTGQDCSEAG